MALTSLPERLVQETFHTHGIAAGVRNMDDWRNMMMSLGSQHIIDEMASELHDQRYPNVPRKDFDRAYGLTEWRDQGATWVGERARGMAQTGRHMAAGFKETAGYLQEDQSDRDTAEELRQPKPRHDRYSWEDLSWTEPWAAFNYGFDHFVDSAPYTASAMGSFVLTAKGAKMGALMGSVFGPAGAAAGGVTGGVIGTLAGLSPLIVGLGGNIAKERAENEGRENPDTSDMAYGYAASLSSALLDRVGMAGATGMTQAGRFVGGGIHGQGGELAGTTAREIGKATLGEMATEATQEVIEDAGGALGTEAGWSGEQALTAAKQGGLIGAVGGGTMRGTVAAGQIGLGNYDDGKPADADVVHAMAAATLTRFDSADLLPRTKRGKQKAKDAVDNPEFAEKMEKAASLLKEAQAASKPGLSVEQPDVVAGTYKIPGTEEEAVRYGEEMAGRFSKLTENQLWRAAARMDENQLRGLTEVFNIDRHTVHTGLQEVASQLRDGGNLKGSALMFQPSLEGAEFYDANLESARAVLHDWVARAEKEADSPFGNEDIYEVWRGKKTIPEATEEVSKKEPEQTGKEEEARALTKEMGDDFHAAMKAPEQSKEIYEEVMYHTARDLAAGMQGVEDTLGPDAAPQAETEAEPVALEPVEGVPAEDIPADIELQSSMELYTEAQQGLRTVLYDGISEGNQIFRPESLKTGAQVMLDPPGAEEPYLAKVAKGPESDGLTMEFNALLGEGEKPVRVSLGQFGNPAQPRVYTPMKRDLGVTPELEAFHKQAQQVADRYDLDPESEEIATAVAEIEANELFPGLGETLDEELAQTQQRIKDAAAAIRERAAETADLEQYVGEVDGLLSRNVPERTTPEGIAERKDLSAAADRLLKDDRVAKLDEARVIGLRGLWRLEREEGAEPPDPAESEEGGGAAEEEEEPGGKEPPTEAEPEPEPAGAEEEAEPEGEAAETEEEPPAKPEGEETTAPPAEQDEESEPGGETRPEPAETEGEAAEEEEPPAPEPKPEPKPAPEPEQETESVDGMDLDALEDAFADEMESIDQIVLQAPRDEEIDALSTRARNIAADELGQDEAWYREKLTELREIRAQIEARAKALGETGEVTGEELSEEEQQAFMEELLAGLDRDALFHWPSHLDEDSEGAKFLRYVVFNDWTVNTFTDYVKMNGGETWSWYAEDENGNVVLPSDRALWNEKNERGERLLDLAARYQMMWANLSKHFAQATTMADLFAAVIRASAGVGGADPTTVNRKHFDIRLKDETLLSEQFTMLSSWQRERTDDITSRHTFNARKEMEVLLQVMKKSGIYRVVDNRTGKEEPIERVGGLAGKLFKDDWKETSFTLSVTRKPGEDETGYQVAEENLRGYGGLFAPIKGVVKDRRPIQALYRMASSFGLAPPYERMMEHIDERSAKEVFDPRPQLSEDVVLRDPEKPDYVKARWEKAGISPVFGKDDPEVLDESAFEGAARYVTDDIIKEDFNLRGVDAGDLSKYPAEIRQRKLLTKNHVYNALMDLAKVLGVESRAIGLGPEQGTGFGGEGDQRLQFLLSPEKQSRQGALAWYRPATADLYLSLLQGDGSVAHEWGHALDYHLRYGSKEANEANLIMRFLLRHDVRAEDVEARIRQIVRENVGDERAAVKRFLESTWKTSAGELVSNTTYYNDASMLAQAPATYNLDYDEGGRVLSYWNNIEELWARAFETWVFDQINPGHSLFLVGGARKADMQDQGEHAGTPSRYPRGEARARFTELFDLFFHGKGTSDGKGIVFNDDGSLHFSPEALAMLREKDKRNDLERQIERFKAEGVVTLVERALAGTSLLTGEPVEASAEPQPEQDIQPSLASPDVDVVPTDQPLSPGSAPKAQFRTRTDDISGISEQSLDILLQARIDRYVADNGRLPRPAVIERMRAQEIERSGRLVSKIVFDPDSRDSAEETLAKRHAYMYTMESKDIAAPDDESARVARAGARAANRQLRRLIESGSDVINDVWNESEELQDKLSEDEHTLATGQDTPPRLALLMQLLVAPWDAKSVLNVHAREGALLTAFSDRTEHYVNDPDPERAQNLRMGGWKATEFDPAGEELWGGEGVGERVFDTIVLDPARGFVESRTSDLGSGREEEHGAPQLLDQHNGRNVIAETRSEKAVWNALKHLEPSTGKAAILIQPGRAEANVLGHIIETYKVQSLTSLRPRYEDIRIDPDLPGHPFFLLYIDQAKDAAVKPDVLEEHRFLEGYGENQAMDLDTVWGRLFKQVSAPKVGHDKVFPDSYQTALRQRTERLERRREAARKRLEQDQKRQTETQFLGKAEYVKRATEMVNELRARHDLRKTQRGWEHWSSEFERLEKMLGDIRGAKADALAAIKFNALSYLAEKLKAADESGYTEFTEADVAESVRNISGQTQSQLPTSVYAEDEFHETRALVPSNLYAPAYLAALKMEEALKGDIFGWLSGKLNMNRAQMQERLSPEQRLGAAMAIYNYERGEGMIIGDQTGMGKGRQIAALIRYSLNEGVQPVFFTKSPDLFHDLARDLEAVGVHEMLGRPVRAVATHADADVPLEAVNYGKGAQRPKGWRGKHKILQISNHASVGAQDKFLENLIGVVKKGDGTLFKAEKTTGYDLVLTTYDQMKSKDTRRGLRHEFLRALAPHSMILFDEAHEMGGQDSDFTSEARKVRDVLQAERKKGVTLKLQQAQYHAMPVGRFLKTFGELQIEGIENPVEGRARGGMTYFSGTFAKNAYVLATLYTRTILREAIPRRMRENPAQLDDALRNGGDELMERLSYGLSQAGQYLRREQNLDKITFQFEDAPIDDHAYERVSAFIGDMARYEQEHIKPFIDAYNEALQKSWRKRVMANGGNPEGIAYKISRTPILNTMHSLREIIDLSLMVPETVRRTREALQNGEKVVITLSQTGHAALAEISESEGIEPIPYRDSFEESIADAATAKKAKADLTIFDYLMRAWRKQQRYKLKDSTGTIIPNPRTSEEFRVLGEEEGMEMDPAVLQGREILKNTLNELRPRFEDLSISPIDQMRTQMEQERLGGRAVTVGELTGRDTALRYEKGTAYLVRRPPSNPATKRKSIDAFNEGPVGTDVMIINETGSTGISAHAAPHKLGPDGEVVLQMDQRVRHMIQTQPEKNINVQIQMYGRINRTGQVEDPLYTILRTKYATQRRLVDALQRKLRTLNATISGTKKSKVDQEEVPMSGPFADKAVLDIVRSDPTVNDELFGVVKFDDGGFPIRQKNLSLRYTNRVGLIGNIQRQGELLDLLEHHTRQNIEFAKKTGHGYHDLSRVRDLQMEIVSRSTQEAGLVDYEGRGLLADPVELLTIMVRQDELPLLPQEAVEVVDKANPQIATKDAYVVTREKMMETETLEAQGEEIRKVFKVRHEGVRGLVLDTFGVGWSLGELHEIGMSAETRGRFMLDEAEAKAHGGVRLAKFMQDVHAFRRKQRDKEMEEGGDVLKQRNGLDLFRAMTSALVKHAKGFEPEGEMKEVDPRIAYLADMLIESGLPLNPAAPKELQKDVDTELQLDWNQWITYQFLKSTSGLTVLEEERAYAKEHHKAIKESVAKLDRQMKEQPDPETQKKLDKAIAAEQEAKVRADKKAEVSATLYNTLVNTYKSHMGNAYRMRDRMELFVPGKIVKTIDHQGEKGEAVVADFKNTKTRTTSLRNPLSEADWQVTLVFNDYQRKKDLQANAIDVVPYSDAAWSQTGMADGRMFMPKFEATPGKVVAEASFDYTQAGGAKTVWERPDYAGFLRSFLGSTKSSTVQGQMLIGSPVRAMSLAGNRGSWVRTTTIDGGEAVGVRLSANWKPPDRPVPFKDNDELWEFLTGQTKTKGYRTVKQYLAPGVARDLELGTEDDLVRLKLAPKSRGFVLEISNRAGLDQYAKDADLKTAIEAAYKATAPHLDETDPDQPAFHYKGDKAPAKFKTQTIMFEVGDRAIAEARALFDAVTAVENRPWEVKKGVRIFREFRKTKGLDEMGEPLPENVASLSSSASTDERLRPLRDPEQADRLMSQWMRRARQLMPEGLIDMQPGVPDYYGHSNLRRQKGHVIANVNLAYATSQDGKEIPYRAIMGLGIGETEKGEVSPNLVDHEFIHAAKQMNLITPEEWSTLTAAIGEYGWMERYDVRERWGEMYAQSPNIEELLREEAIAEAFMDYVNNRDAFVSHIGEVGGNRDSRHAWAVIKSLFERLIRYLGKLARVIRDDGQRPPQVLAIFEFFERGGARERGEEFLRKVMDASLWTGPRETDTQHVGRNLVERTVDYLMRYDYYGPRGKADPFASKDFTKKFRAANDAGWMVYRTPIGSISKTATWIQLAGFDEKTVQKLLATKRDGVIPWEVFMMEQAIFFDPLQSWAWVNRQAVREMTQVWEAQAGLKEPYSVDSPSEQRNLTRLKGRAAVSFNPYVKADSPVVETRLRTLASVSARADSPVRHRGFADPEREKRYRDARRGRRSGRGEMMARVHDSLRLLKELTRHFEHLPSEAQFANVKEQMLFVRNAHQGAAAKATNNLERVVGGLTPDEYDVLNRYFLLNDLLYEAQRGHDLPFGFTGEEEVMMELAKVEAAVNGNSKLKERARRRQEIGDVLREELVRHDVLSEAQVANTAYYRHQVLEYALARKQNMGKIKTPYWQRRRGSDMDINANFYEAEAEWQYKAYIDMEVAKLINYLRESKDNKMREFVAAGKARNATNLANMLREELSRAFLNGSYPEGPDMVEKARHASTARDLWGILKAYKDKYPSESDKIEEDAPLIHEWAMYQSRIGRSIGMLESALKAMPPALRNSLPKDVEAAIRKFLGARRGEGEPDGLRTILDFFTQHGKVSKQATISAASYLKWTGMRDQFMRARVPDHVNVRSAAALLAAFDPDGRYGIWQPDSFDGKQRTFHMFTAKTLSNNIVDRVMDDMTERIAKGLSVEPEEVFKLLDGMRNATVRGGLKEVFILDRRLIETLNNFTDKFEENRIAQVMARTHNLLKKFMLFAPTRFLRYYINNLSGDMDAIVGGDRSKDIARKLKPAWKEITGLLKGEKRSELLEIAINKGVIQSGFTAMEVTEELNYVTDRFGDLLLQSGDKIMRAVAKWPFAKGKQYFHWAYTTARIRENAFRYAAFLAYMEAFEKAEKKVGHDIHDQLLEIGLGYTNPTDAMAIDNVVDRAARMARDQMGDYTNISRFGRAASQVGFLFFWRWLESNARRYNARIANVYRMYKLSRTRGKSLSASASMSVLMAYKVLRFYALLTAFNMIFMGDEEDEMSTEERLRLHINLGIWNDQLTTIRFQGALSDYLGWFGMEEAGATLMEVQRGRAAPMDIFKHVSTAPLNRVANAITPTVKLPIELGVTGSWFPDVMNPRQIRDPWVHASRAFAMDPEVRAIQKYVLGKSSPSRPWVQRLPNLLVYTREPGELAYFKVRGLGYRFREQESGEGAITRIDERSRALYNYRASLKLGDEVSQALALEEMRRLGVNSQSLRSSIRNSRPLGMLSKRQKAKLMQTWTPREQDDYQRAVEYYKSTFLFGGGWAQ